jgi:redox-sensitive bicupin YhaK (pirin superfamily)
LARRDKHVEPTAQVVRAQDPPTHGESAIVRTLVGPGSPVELGAPTLILDVELGNGAAFSQPIPAEFNAFVWMLQGKTDLGSNRRRAAQSQIVVLGPGAALTVAVATRGVCFMLMSGKPYGKQPIFNGPYVD